jgi:lipopolysaccharide export system permease protein
MTVFRRYINRGFIAYFAFMLAALTSLALTLDLAEEGDRVLGSVHGGALGLLRYSALRLPEIIGQMLPVSTLLGMIVILGQFLRHSEMVALWGSGVSPLQLMKALLPTALVLAGITLVNSDLAVPDTRSVLREWGVGEARKSGIVTEDGAMAWLLSGDDVVRAPNRADPSGALANVTIFRRDTDGRLLERIDAERATPQADGWLLSGVTRYGIDPAITTTLESLPWNGRIDVAALPLIVSQMRDLQSSDLLSLIAHAGYGQRPTDRYRTWLHARIASALVPALMICLAISLAQRFRRTGAFGALLLSSIGIGFGFLALDGVCLALGESGLMPAWFAAWSPKLALVCLIGTFVAYREG